MSVRNTELEQWLREKVEYDPETGEMYLGDYTLGYPWGPWKNGKKYLYFSYRGKRIKVHRAAFFKMTGRWPKITDHIDRDIHNNRWVNLREATSTESNRNRRGTRWTRRGGAVR